MTIEQSPEQRAKVDEFQRKHRIVLLTMLFTDIVGSTQLKQRLGERAAIELTERHHALFRETVLRFSDAEEIATAGDSFFIVFAKPSDAVQFALLAQRAVRELARETGFASRSARTRTRLVSLRSSPSALRRRSRPESPAIGS